MRRAYSYIRFSTPGQIQGDSLRRQLALTRQWCEARGVELVEDYRDLGVSAYRQRNATQGKLARFIEAVEAGSIPRGSVLIVESLDRITRTELSDAVALFLRLINGGVTVVTLADAKEYTKATIDANIGELMMSLVILSRANDESRMKSLRVSAAHAARRKAAAEGKPVEAWNVGPQWLEYKGGEWHVNRERGSMVHRLYSLAAEGFSLRDIADRLHAEGFRPLRGKGIFHTRSLRIILQNRAAMGELVLRGGSANAATIPGYYPAVVSATEWARANAIFAASEHKPGRRNHLNIFRGILKDADGNSCGLNILDDKRTGKRWARFLAWNPATGRSRSTGWHLAPLQTLVLSSLDQAKLAMVARVPRQVQAREAIASELAETDAKIANLVQAIANGYSAALEAALRALEVKRAELQTRLTAASITSAAGAPAEWDAMPGNDPARLAAHLRAVVSRIILLDRETVRVELRAGYSYVARVTPQGFEIEAPKAIVG